MSIMGAPNTSATVPVEVPADPHSAAQERARFFHSGTAFNVKHSAVPATVFIDELAAAQNATASAFIACDQSRALDVAFAATTPLMLARYAAIVPHGRLAATFVATGTIWYVIAGSGRLAVGEESVTWQRGDVVVTPGGITTDLVAFDQGALLWLVTNEPQLAFDHLHPSVDNDRPVELVHYSAAEIARQLERVVAAGGDGDTAGIALIFSAERQVASRNIMPSLTLSLNTVPAREHQRMHRHNSAAITLILAGSMCYSMVGAERCDWSPYATLVTPATEPHSHHNDGAERALFLIVQDGGLHYHARTMGFTFLEPATPSLG